MGQGAIRSGQRRRVDRPDRRDLSVLRLGRRWCAALLEHGTLPPLTFRYQDQRWSSRWRS